VSLSDGSIAVGYNRGSLIELEDESKLKNCTCTPTTIGIAYDGNVILCCHDYLNTVKLGNIKTERLLDIWKKPYYKQLRKELKMGESKLDLYKKCKIGRLPQTQ
jgi:radical SAM protein with 4Fe4S-binding SPASM domain